MSQPRRVVVVDDNEVVLRLVREALSGPDFEVHTFKDSREALFKLHQICPHLIISDLLMPGMDGREFFQHVKHAPELREIPFIFLSGVQSNEEIVSWLERGADDFVNKPITLQRLNAKIRATLRLADRGHEDRRQDRLSGALGDAGALPLIRYCEDVRLTGRLTVRHADVERWAEFAGGDLTVAGGHPPEVGVSDAVDALLAVRDGSYEIVQQRLDPTRLEYLQAAVAPSTSSTPSAGATPTPAPPPALAATLPGGRLARVSVRGEDLEIQTEAENRPNLTITTLVTRAGRVARKIESSWAHALQRREDEDLAKAQLERQHERVVASVRSLGFAPRPTAPATTTTVDGPLLAWTASFVAEQVRDLLGNVMTVTLLRRAHTRVSAERPLLAAFEISPDAVVTVPANATTLATTAVAALAAWMAVFLAEAAAVIPAASRIKVRQATHMMETELDRLGFYHALRAAAGRDWD